MRLSPHQGKSLRTLARCRTSALALSPRRLLATDRQTVTFAYTDYAARGLLIS